MPDIGGINGPQGPRPVGRRSGVESTGRTDNSSVGNSREDTVEISSEAVQRAQQAEFLSRLEQVDEIRQERVQAIRAQLDEGTYDVDGHLGQAVDGLLDDIGLGALE